MCARSDGLEAAAAEPLIQPDGKASSTNAPLGMCAAVSAACCMSGYVLVSEYMTRQHETSGFLLLRQLVASGFMVVLAWSKHGMAALEMPRSQWRDVRLLGAFQFLNAVLFLHGLSLAGAFLTAVCQLSIPVLTFAATAISGLERPSIRRAAAMLTIVCGCALTAGGHTMHEAAGAAAAAAATDPSAVAMLGGGASRGSAGMHVEGRRLWHAHARSFDSKRGSHRRRSPTPATFIGVGAPHAALLGVMLLLAQCASFVGIVLVQRRVLRQHPVSVVVLWSYVLATAWTSAYCVVAGSVWRLSEQLTCWSDVLSLGFSALFGSVGYFEAIAVATKHLSPTLVACSVALEPLAISSFGAVFAGHVTTPLEVAGYALASLGACAMAMIGDDGRGGGPGGASGLRRNASGASLSRDSVELNQPMSLPAAGGSGLPSPRVRPSAGPSFEETDSEVDRTVRFST